MVGTRRPLVTVERRFVDAAVDVVVEDWRTRWSPVEKLSARDWDVIGLEWTAELCDVLDAVADHLLELVGGIRTGVAGGVASVLMTFGVPPLLAEILGRLVANWLLEGLGPVGTTALRLKELGVLLCASSGELEHCACLVDVVTMLGVKGFKKELHEALGLGSDKGGPSTTAGDGEPNPRPDNNRDAADRAADTGGSRGRGSDSMPAGGRAPAADARSGGRVAGDGTRSDPTGAFPGGGSPRTAGQRSPAAGAPDDAAPDAGASRGGWSGRGSAGPGGEAAVDPRPGSKGRDGGPAAQRRSGRGSAPSDGDDRDRGVSDGPTGGGGIGTDPAGGAAGAGSSGTGPRGRDSGAPGGAASAPGPAGPDSGPWPGSGTSGGISGARPAATRSAVARSTGAAVTRPDRPIADASEVVRGATATVPPAVFG